MAKKKSKSVKNQISKNKNLEKENVTALEDKIIYAMANTSIILMSTMKGAFTQVIGSTMGVLASGMAEAMGGKEASDKVGQEIKNGLPEIDDKMKTGISDLKKEIYAQMHQKRKELEQVLSNPAFEVGPKIIEKYDFNLPKLTKELSDDALTQYSQMLVNENADFAKMFKELMEWLNSLPKPTE